jgi:hypothetical protein
MHVPCASAAGPASATGSALVGRPSHAGPHTGRAARSKRLRSGIQCSRMRLSARHPAQNLLAASRDPGRSRCPPDQDLDDSDAAVNGGMREDYHRLRAADLGAGMALRT